MKNGATSEQIEAFKQQCEEADVSTWSLKVYTLGKGFLHFDATRDRYSNFVLSRLGNLNTIQCKESNSKHVFVLLFNIGNTFSDVSKKKILVLWVKVNEVWVLLYCYFTNFVRE